MKILYDPVCPLVDRSVGWPFYQIFLKGGGEFHFHAPIGELVIEISGDVSRCRAF